MATECGGRSSRKGFDAEGVSSWDAFPVNPGHLLVVPRRHVATWFDASEEERASILKALDEAKVLIDGRHHPDGYNIGVNVGQVAGQTVSTCTST
jgi:diadenosine tetraphosphate (Ap4A) HIT family hydrolase